MEPLVLTDKSIYPSDEYIFGIIGKNSVHWNQLMKSVGEKFPASAGEWNYYNDGKNWLYKRVLKKKTLFWIGIQHDTFRITFYFGDKAEDSIMSSSVSEALKEQFSSGKHYGKIRGITITVNEPSDVINAVILAELRSKY